jgi:hypothetical protein
MKQAFSDPIARGFVLDEISQNSKIVGYGSCIVGFAPGCSIFVTASKVIDAANAFDTARGIAAGEVPTSVGIERAMKIGTGMVLGKAAEWAGGYAGEQAWRYGTRAFGPQVGGWLGQTISYGLPSVLKEWFALSGTSKWLSAPLVNGYMSFLNYLGNLYYSDYGYYGGYGGAWGGPPGQGK